MSASWSVAKGLASSQLASHVLFAMEEGLSASLQITCLALSPVDPTNTPNVTRYISVSLVAWHKHGKWQGLHSPNE